MFISNKFEENANDQEEFTKLEKLNNDYLIKLINSAEKIGETLNKDFKHTIIVYKLISII